MNKESLIKTCLLGLQKQSYEYVLETFKALTLDEIMKVFIEYATPYIQQSKELPNGKNLQIELIFPQELKITLKLTYDQEDEEHLFEAIFHKFYGTDFICGYLDDGDGYEYNYTKRKFLNAKKEIERMLACIQS